MPMYFPDLKSVQQLAEHMQSNKGDKKYLGKAPETEEELPQARIDLGRYMREVWQDEIAAIEVEMAVDVDNYDERITEGIFGRIRHV